MQTQNPLLDEISKLTTAAVVSLEISSSSGFWVCMFRP